MDKLPVEILRDIFHKSLPSVKTLRTTRSPSVTIPLYISHVCRRWREVALSFGILWSYLVIEYGGTDAEVMRKAKLEIFNTWLQRTKLSPLNFFVILWPYKGEEESRGVELITRTLLLHQRRWRDLVCAWTLEHVPGLSRIKATDMPALTDLTLKFYDWKCKELPHVCIAESSHLESLMLCGKFTFECGANLKYALKRVQLCFNARDERAVECCLDVLSACPNLTHLWFETHDSKDSPKTTQETAIDRPPFSRDIQELTLSDTSSDFASVVISKLTLPLLKALVFKTNNFHSRSPVLYEFVQRSCPPLERLEVQGTHAQQELLAPLLPLLHSLRDLGLHGVKPVWLFQKFSREGCMICPVLRCIRLTKLISPDDDELTEYLDALCTMVESRGSDSGVVSVADGHLGCGEFLASNIRQHYDEMKESIRYVDGAYDLRIDLEGR